MASEDVKKRFLQEVKLRAYDDQYIDRDEEREILKAAIELNVSIDSARAALHQVCENNGFVVESVILNKVKELMETFAGNDGKIDEKEFNDAVTVCEKASQGKLSGQQCKKMVYDVMVESNYVTKTGIFSNWVKKVKKELGIA